MIRGNLRDLAQRIQELASNHSCYSQVAPIIANTVDHICALARIEDVNKVIGALDGLAKQGDDNPQAKID